jgi:hypothetical protein
MESMTSLLAILAGLLVRLAIPISVTAMLIYFLRKLDARWQTEAQMPMTAEKPNCWEIKGCTPEQMKNCIAGKSSLPCWQAYRLPNGYLRDECISCDVFREAPVPA